jgi:WXG100 family type VII secretion target
MDIEAVRAIQRKLRELQGQILNDIRRPNVTVANLQPNWRGNSANEFFALYNTSSGNISRIAGKLAEIAEELGEEIEKYERVAARLAR